MYGYGSDGYTMLSTALLSNELLSGTLGEALGYLLTFLATAAGYRLLTYLKARRMQRHKYNVSETIQGDRAILDLLQQLRDATSAARAWVMQFHNGSNFFDGSPVKRVSVSYEQVAHGVSSEAQNYQNIPISMFTPGMECILLNNAELIFTDKLPPGHFRSSFELMCVVAYQFLPLYKDRLIVGAVCVQFCDMAFAAGLTEAEPEIKRYATLLELEFAKHG